MVTGLSRAVQITYDMPEGSYLASGMYLQRELRGDGGLVLTADHCADGNPGSYRVYLSDHSEHDAEVVWRSSSTLADLAILRVPGLPDVQPIQLALLDRVSTHSLQCRCLCFPHWKKDASWQVHGSISPTANQKARLRESEAPHSPTVSLTINVDQTEMPEHGGSPSAFDSLVRGASGGGVLAAHYGDDVCVGVVSCRHKASAVATLQVAEFASVSALPYTKRQEFWALLLRDGINGVQNLPIVQGQTLASEVAERVAHLSRQSQTADSSPTGEAAARLVSSYFDQTVRPLAIHDVHRADERATAFRFAAQDERRWLWWRAAPWAGKTSLMADLATHPPEGVQVAAFFVIGREAAANNRDAFLDRILPQLALLAGDTVVDLSPATPAVRLERFVDLLTRAGDCCGRQNTRLLLLVDGLDEDQSDSRSSIAGAIPARLPPGVNVLAASRTNPPLDVPYNHPLRDGAYLETLSPAAGASASQEQAFDELQELWKFQYPLGRDLACLTAAARAPLTAIDLAELAVKTTGRHIDAPAVNDILRHRAARVFHSTPDANGQLGYRLGHDTLDDKVIENLDPRRRRTPGTTQRWLEHTHRVLRPWRDHIHAWVEALANDGWPDSTPTYAGADYFRMLEETNDRPRLTALAGDLRRHDFLYKTTYTDAEARRELSKALYVQVNHPDPDLPTVVTLSVYLDAVANRVAQLPPSIFSVWTKCGLGDRAEQVARTITDPSQHTRALTVVAEELAATDPERAQKLISEATRVARTIADPDQQSRGLYSLAHVLAATDLDGSQRLLSEAVQVARTINDSLSRSRTLAALTKDLADLDLAEQVARTITESSLQVDALCAQAAAVAATNSDHAGRLISEAEQIARAATDPDEQVDALCVVARAVAPTDPDRAQGLTSEAEQVARAIVTDLEEEAAVTDHEDPEDLAAWLAMVLAQLASMIATIDPDRAQELASEAEELARTITDPEEQAATFSELSAALATINLGLAEQLARTITDPHHLSHALVRLANELTTIDPDRAEHLIQAITDPDQQAWALVRLANELTGDPDRAEHLANAIAEPSQRARALTDLARVFATTKPDRARRLASEAEQVASTLADLGRRASALVALADVLATTDPARAQRLLAEAERASRATAASQQSRTLSSLVSQLAAANPEVAERLADTITDPGDHAQALVAVAKGLAPNNPAHAKKLLSEAEQDARAITDPDDQIDMLAELTMAFATSDPDRAQQVGCTIDDPEEQDRVLTWLAESLVTTDPTRAERAARAITDPDDRAWALTKFAKVLTTTDPGQAEQVAHSVTEPYPRTEALVTLATALAPIDPDRAKRLLSDAEQAARTINDTNDQAWALARLAEALITADPNQAEEVTRTIVDPSVQTKALVTLATALAPIDPDRAKRLLSDAEQAARTINDTNHQAWALTRLARVLISTDPDHAADVARSITNPSRIANPSELPHQARVLTELAVTLATTDADRAEKLARTITDPKDQIRALSELADSLATSDPDRARSLAEREMQRLVALAADGAWRSTLPLLSLLDPGTIQTAARAYLRISRFQASLTR